MRSHPQLPLATPEAESQVNFKRGKAPQGETSTTEPGNLLSPSVETPFSSPQLRNRPLSEASCFLNFGSVPVELSPPSVGLEGETIITSLTPVDLFPVSPIQVPSPPSSPPPNIPMVGENSPHDQNGGYYSLQVCSPSTTSASQCPSSRWLPQTAAQVYGRGGHNCRRTP
jgi:hypothetical protein